MTIDYRLSTNNYHLCTPTRLSYLRALLAVARKDWRQYWRYPLNAASSIFQPLIWLAPAYFMGKAFSVNGQALGFAAYTGTTDFMSFLLLGTALASFVGAVFWGMGYSLKDDMNAGVLEANWLCPIPRLFLLVGHTFTNLLVTAITSAVMLAVAGLLFGFHPTGEVLAAVLAALPMLIGLYGFGFAMAALVLVLRDANMLVDISNFVVQLLSGSQFPVTALPKWLLPVAFAMPLTYGFDAVRGLLLGTQTLLPIQVEIALLIVFMFVMIALGALAFHSMERWARRQGTLGQH